MSLLCPAKGTTTESNLLESLASLALKSHLQRVHTQCANTPFSVQVGATASAATVAYLPSLYLCSSFCVDFGASLPLIPQL